MFRSFFFLSIIKVISHALEISAIEDKMRRELRHILDHVRILLHGRASVAGVLLQSGNKHVEVHQPVISSHDRFFFSTRDGREKIVDVAAGETRSGAAGVSNAAPGESASSTIRAGRGQNGGGIGAGEDK